MRLVYFYAREKEIDLEHWKAEGHHKLFTILAQCGIFDRIDVYTENLSGNTYCVPFIEDRYEMTALSRAPDYDFDVPEDSVVWVRGGFKPWIETLLEVPDLKKKHWVLFYGANTGNERWPYWHIILNDLIDVPDDRQLPHKYSIPYRKPINTNVFYFDESIQRDIDICVGASNVHDKKGQYITAKILKRYHERTGRWLRSFMPGSSRGGAETKRMYEGIMRGDYGPMRATGTIPRVDLADRLRRTKTFIHLGGGGQGDRGPMEALSCGCYLILADSGRHAPWLDRIPEACTIVRDPDNPNKIDYLTDLVDKSLRNTSTPRNLFSTYYTVENGIYTNTVVDFQQMVSFFKETPKPNVMAFKEYYDETILPRKGNVRRA